MSRSAAYMFTMIAGSLLQAGDYNEFIRFVVAELSSGAKIGSSSGMSSRRSSSEPLLRPLSFPPEQIPGFPDGVLELFRSDEASMSRRGMPEDGIDGAKLLPHVETVKNPVLKALVLPPVPTA